MSNAGTDDSVATACLAEQPEEFSNLKRENEHISSLSMIDFVEKVPVSVRLRNCIKLAAQENVLPFKTIGEYLAAGDKAETLLLTIRNFGAGCAREFTGLVEKLKADNGIYEAIANPVGYGAKKPSEFLCSLSLVDLVNKAHVSVRLRNAFNLAAKQGTLPFETIGDFYAAGSAGRRQLLDMKNLGRSSAEEFIQLLDELATYDPTEQDFSNIRSISRKDDFVQSSEFLALYNAGFSYQDIAEKYDLSECTVKKYLTDHPDFEKRTSSVISARQSAKLAKSNEFLELYKQGLSYQEIGDKFGISRERVRQILEINPEFHSYLEAYESAKEQAAREKRERAKQKSEENNLLYRYPDQIAEFWDYEKNQDLNPSEIPAGSTSLEVWLKCPIDGYSWKKRPNDITTSWDRGKRGCPVCAGKTKKPTKQSALVEDYPEFIIDYWNFEKNLSNGLDPQVITLASNRKVWLKCPHDGHEWEARIHSLVKQQWSKGNAGCRVCNGTHTRKVGEWNRHAPLTIEFPAEVEKYWDYEKNNNNDLYPDKVTAGSAKKAWFKCPIDGYHWFSAIAPTARAWEKGVSGCSRCGKGWTTEAIRQFVASLEKHIPNLTQAERYKIFEQSGIFESKAAESISLVKDIIKGKLSGQKLKEYIEGKESKPYTVTTEGSNESFSDHDLGFLDADSTLETINISQDRDESSESTGSSGELPSVNVKNSLEFLSSQVVASADQEAIDYFVASRRNRIWAEVFEDESAVIAVESFCDDGYGRQVRDEFLDEYYQARDMPIPAGWAFRINGKITAPNLMQKLAAVRLRNQHRMLNLSLTGTGKTIGGILSSRIIDARLTVIICPLDTIPNWNAEIKHTFPDSKVTIKNFDPYWSDIETGHHYILLNHEMFQQASSASDIRGLLSRFKIDLIVVDEIHRCKQRGDDPSKRRQMILALVTNAAEINPDLHVLGMSATPVINNLKEGKSLVELVSGVERADLGERATLNNCMRLHQAFVTFGIRSRVKPKIRISRTTIPVDCTDLVEEIREHGTSVVKMEQILTRARISVILPEIRPKTIIYTHYLEGIANQLELAITSAGWTVGFHIGGDKSGRDGFINGSTDVLIASSAMAVGVDGFQRVCDRLILNIPPWTSAELEQLEGRLNRQGQVHESLTIVIPVTYGVDNGERWSWDEGKLARLQNKQTVADAAVDGVMPEGQLRSESQAFRDLRKWLDRLASGEQKSVLRPKIRVPLPEIDIANVNRRQIQYGDFSRMNALWNRSHSRTNYRRVQNNPEEWMQYHTLYQEARKTWSVIPYQEAIQWLSKRSNLVVGDFGCGEALIAQALSDKHTIHSFDFVAINHSVTECDIARVPLEDSCLDVAMFNLSMMGLNVSDYIREATRTLKLDGQLWIYETVSRIKNVPQFVHALQLAGFRIIESSEVWKFWFIRAIKSEDVDFSLVSIDFIVSEN